MDLTSPRDGPLPLEVVKPGAIIADDLKLDVTLRLRPYPADLPELPRPPQMGDLAPPLPATLRPVGSSQLPERSGRAHLLFFWATWCVPCKKAVPEVSAFAKAMGMPVLAISDESPDTVAAFLSKQADFHFQVAVDPVRNSFIAHGVSGTPTNLLVDWEGKILHRQVGYSPAKGLTVEGWSWSQP